MGILYESGSWGVFNFLFLSVFMGGAASMATGRALARTWRPVWHCAFYAAPIALTVAFLHYALFEESVISTEALSDAIVETGTSIGSGAQMAVFALRGAGALFILHTALALLGYRLTRRRQMAMQYGFSPAGSP